MPKKMVTVYVDEVLHTKAKKIVGNMSAFVENAIKSAIVADSPMPEMNVELSKAIAELGYKEEEVRIIKDKISFIQDAINKRAEQEKARGDVMAQALSNKTVIARLRTIIENPTQPVLEANTRAIGSMLNASITIGQVQEMITKLKEMEDNARGNTTTND